MPDAPYLRDEEWPAARRGHGAAAAAEPESPRDGRAAAAEPESPKDGRGAAAEPESPRDEAAAATIGREPESPRWTVAPRPLNVETSGTPPRHLAFMSGVLTSASAQAFARSADTVTPSGLSFW